MTRYHQIAWALLLFVGVGGCATSGAHMGRSAKLGEGVNPDRAFVPLERIEPRVKPPAHGEALKPLSERARAQIQKATELIQEERYTAAAIELERALRYDPKHPDIHRALATLHWQAGNVMRAQAHAKTALEGRPDDGVAYYILGRAHLANKEPAAAIVAFRSALKCPNIGGDREVNALCRFHLAEALAGEGYLQAALGLYAESQKILSDAAFQSPQQETASLAASKYRRLRVAQSALLEKLGRFAEAAEMLKPDVDASSGDVEWGCRYARLLMQANRLNDALAAARKLPLNEKRVYELVYKVHDAAGYPERIVDDLRSALAKNAGDDRLVSFLADVLRRLHRDDEAVEVLQTHLAAAPGDVELRSTLLQLFVKQSQWKKAIDVCAGGIDADPSSAAKYEDMLSAAKITAGGLKELLAAAPARIAPTQAYLYGFLATRAGQFDAALPWLESAFERSPASLPIRVALGNLYLHLYRYKDGMRVCGVDDESVHRNARLEFVLGMIYERLDRFDEATQHLQEAIRKDRDYTDAMFELAALQRRSSQTLQGRRQLKVLLDAHPDNEKARELLVAIHLEEQRFDEAVQQLEELYKRAKTPLVRARCQAFLDHLKNKDIDAYRQTLLDAMKQYGADADTWLAIAQSYLDPLKDAEAKREATLHALEMEPDNEEALLGMVEASRNLLDFEDAVKYMRTLLRRRPNRYQWRLGYNERARDGSGMTRWYGLVELYWIIQDYDAALRVIDEGLAKDNLDDSVVDAYRRMRVDTLIRADRDDEALQQLVQWRESDKANTNLALMLANEYVRQDKADLAVPIAEKLYKDFPNRHMLSVVIRDLVAAKKRQRAAQYVLDWLDTDPENDDVVALLADVVTGQENADDGLDLVRNQLLRSIDRERLQNAELLLIQRAERYDDGLTLIDSLIDEIMMLLRGAADPQEVDNSLQNASEERLSRLPNQPFVPSRLSDRLVQLRRFQLQMLMSNKEYDAALDLLRDWLDRARGADERYDYLNFMAMFQRMDGDENGANEALQRALVLRPDNITLNNDIAYSWIDQGIRIEEAEPMIRMALIDSPLQSSYLDTYGWLLYKKGLFADARKWLKRANTARGGEDPVILDHYGDALWRSGEHEDALTKWREALKATKSRSDAPFVSADEQRVIDTVEGKIEAAAGDKEPEVAPLAKKEN